MRRNKLAVVVFLNPFHDYLQYFVEFVGREPLDVLGAGIEVATYVGEDSEVGIGRGSVTFEDFKIRFAGRQTEPNTLIICDGVVEDCLNSYVCVLIEDAHLIPFAFIVELDILHHHVGGRMTCYSTNIFRDIPLRRHIVTNVRRAT